MFSVISSAILSFLIISLSIHIRIMYGINNEERPWQRSDRGRFLPSGKKASSERVVRAQGAKHQKQNIFLYLYVCVIQHRNWPLRPTILNAYGTNASPDGPCTRTHTNEAFSCWFCSNSFRVDRARRENVCLSSQGMLSNRSACPEFIKMVWVLIWLWKPPLLYISHHVRSIAW